MDVIVFAAPGGASAPERLMAGAQTAAALDLVEMALECPLVGRVVVATGAMDLATALEGHPGVSVERDEPGKAFHFGRRLQETVARHGMRRPLYFGSGSAPLLGQRSLEGLCGRLLAAERTVIANNVRSADFFGFTPPEALLRVELPGDQDNSIPFLLSHFGGLSAESLEPALEHAFNLDTPADLAILKVLGQTKGHARRFLEGSSLDTGRLEAALPVLVGRRDEVALIGRVATDIWGQVPSDLIPGPKRLYVEERGMKATGREGRGEVRSLVGYLLEAVGPRRLFEYLAGLSQAVFFDTRVVFHHLHLRLSAADRFASDLGDVTAIEDATARSFTQAALDCPIPVILGGHNVVAGGLWALAQEAWNRADAGLLAGH